MQYGTGPTAAVQVDYGLLVHLQCVGNSTTSKRVAGAKRQQEHVRDSGRSID